MSTYTRLAAHLNIVGAKLSHGDISRHIQLSNLPNSLNDKFFIFTGLGQQLFPMLSMGGHGAIDGLAGIFPKVIVHLYNLTQDYVNGNTKDPQSALQSIRQLQTLVSQAEEFVVEWGTVGIKVAVGMVIGSKHHLSQQQLQCRSPLQGGMPAVEWEKWENGVFGDMKRKVEELEHQA